MHHPHVSLDLFPDGLRPARALAGRRWRCPSRDEAFDVVARLRRRRALRATTRSRSPSSTRVLRPGGRMLLSVPAYHWAWSDHDVRAGHHRRYTRPRLVRPGRGAGLTVERPTYAFGSVFPFFLAERLAAGSGPGRPSGDSRA